MSRARLEALMLALPGVIALVTLMGAAMPTPPEFDLLVRGGTVFDGSGAPGIRVDVGIKSGRIARVGDLKGLRAARVVDATGLVVAPGFIDVHTHADDLAERPGAENFLRMGVTTLVAGNCGSSPVDVGAALAKVRQTRAAVNFGTLVGHNAVRREVMGDDRRAPTAAELERMQSLVTRAVRDGALGLSTGLQYTPGIYAEPGEIADLAKAACAAGGLYASHMRNEGTRIDEALAETIAVGETAGCRVQVSHLKIDSPKNWGASARALAALDAARRRGVDVLADQYAYTAAGSSLSIRLPDWAREGGDAKIRERLADGPTWERIRTDMKGLLAERGFTDLSFATLAHYPPDPSLQGLNLKQIAAKLERGDSADAQLEAFRKLLLREDAGVVYHLMSEDDVERVMRHPAVSVASDSLVLVPGEGSPHPRGYGNNARVLGRYVREKKVVSLEEAIRKMTSLPARHFRLEGRGSIQEGQAADLALFDPAKVRDAATFEKPHAYAEGFPYVVVNGVLVIDGGKPTGARPGQVLTLPAGR
ncbi:MAG TPA: D-aminoacylase [Thermoanaerobaculia bacterium]|nr:D-aminoacylase [Thermoanaerobaculia bacterium]